MTNLAKISTVSKATELYRQLSGYRRILAKLQEDDGGGLCFEVGVYGVQFAHRMIVVTPVILEHVGAETEAKIAELRTKLLDLGFDPDEDLSNGDEY